MIQRIGILGIVVASAAALGPVPVAGQCGSVRQEASREVRLINSGMACWPEGRAWRLERQWSVGGAAGPLAFAGVAGAVLAADQVVVLDGRGREIRVIGFDGQERRRFGRAGRGPGEFMKPVATAVRADTIIVVDAQQRRVSLFTWEGVPIREQNLALHYSTHGSPVRAWALADGRLVMETHRGIGLASDTAENRAKLYLIDLKDSTSTHLHTSSVPAALAGRTSKMALAVEPPRWGLKQSYAVSPDGLIAHGNGSDFEITVARIQGGPGQGLFIPLFSMVHTRTREEIGRDDLQRFRARGSPNAETNPETSRALAAAVEAYPIPRRWPAYSQLLMDGEARIWAYEAPINTDAAGRYHVISREGVYFGAVDVPPRTTLMSVARHHAIGLRRDELGVDYVELYELRR